MNTIRMEGAFFFWELSYYWVLIVIFITRKVTVSWYHTVHLDIESSMLWIVSYLACACCSSTWAIVLTKHVSTFSESDQPLSEPRIEFCCTLSLSNYYHHANVNFRNILPRSWLLILRINQFCHGIQLLIRKNKVSQGGLQRPPEWLLHHGIFLLFPASNLLFIWWSLFQIMDMLGPSLWDSWNSLGQSWVPVVTASLKYIYLLDKSHH
jgi:hypothetical protein